MLKRLFGKKENPALPLEQPPAAPHDLTDASFTTRVGEPEGLVVVDFWAEWCQPCQVMSAHVEFLARDFAGRLTVFALDTDENQRTAERYIVKSLPTLIFFRHGEEVHRTVGVSTYEDLKRQVDRLLAGTGSELAK